ncbi:hypothetical protein TIFTF001_049098 [Ficus carica]|uniref:Uncharacterized protein n=1 Tax=Ficus carica TaxID=3494 RepID=A0AA87YUZ1_FICCA|nr:hypothetical protein TIFTF001_049098 [Ficus carica]
MFNKHKAPPYWSEAIDMVFCFCFVLAFKENGKNVGRVPDLNHVFMVTHSYVRKPDVSSAKEVSFEFRLTDSVEIEIERCGIRIERLQDTVDFVTSNGDYLLGGSSDFLDEPEQSNSIDRLRDSRTTSEES